MLLQGAVVPGCRWALVVGLPVSFESCFGDRVLVGGLRVEVEVLDDGRTHFRASLEALGGVARQLLRLRFA